MLAELHGNWLLESKSEEPHLGLPRPCEPCEEVTRLPSSDDMDKEVRSASKHASANEDGTMREHEE